MQVGLQTCGNMWNKDLENLRSDIEQIFQISLIIQRLKSKK